MHERNIYRNPPDFGDMAKRHSFLAPFVSLNSAGVPKINFKDPEALKALTKALLLDDFLLNVEIPEGVLVPTVPLRLNYILWVEDLLSYNNNFGKSGNQICGIDVGTGSTAIYALIAARKNQWRMVGTEVDPESSMVAKFNVKQNNLDQLIEVRYVKQSVLSEVLKESHPGQYDFTMCNPPFFGSDEETESVQKSRKGDRPGPSGAKTGTKNELVVEGGEISFIQEMIRDSKTHSQSVRVFTTMIGIKRHLKELLSNLQSVGVKNITTTEFSQGKTSRWGIAWSFDPNVNLKPPSEVQYTFEKLPGCLNLHDYIFSQLQNLKLQSLEWIADVNAAMECDSLTGGQPRVIHFVATENTWTGQRRRRREMERQKQLEDEICPSPTKKIKLDSEGKTNGHGGETSPPNILLECHVTIYREGPTGLVSMKLLSGSLGKDALNQIMTYLKNCYNRDAQTPSTELYQLMECEG